MSAPWLHHCTRWWIKFLLPLSRNCHSSLPWRRKNKKENLPLFFLTVQLLQKHEGLLTFAVQFMSRKTLILKHQTFTFKIPQRRGTLVHCLLMMQWGGTDPQCYVSTFISRQLWFSIICGIISRKEYSVSGRSPFMTCVQ